MADRKPGTKKYKVDWRFNQRIVTDHFGSLKYSSSSKALGEPISNALDAGASHVAVELSYSQMDIPEALQITDNGRGISPRVIKARFAEIGVTPDPGGASAVHLGRFGIGRLAVHRIGSLSKWESVSRADDGKSVKIAFSLSSIGPNELVVTEGQVPNSIPTGTTISIYNLRDTQGAALTPRAIADDLAAQFCGYLLGNPSKVIEVQGDPIDVTAMITRQETETIPANESISTPTTINHVLLHRPVDRSRFPAQVLFSAKGRTVARCDPEIPLRPNYLAVAECPYLETIVSSNRESIIEMDEGFRSLLAAVRTRIVSFHERLRDEHGHEFIEQARKEEYYPYPAGSNDPVTTTKQAIFDVVLDKVNEHANLEGMTKRQQAIVFRLLNRALGNENLLEILREIAQLSDADMEQFRQTLESTTLESIIRLSSVVTERLQFLTILHDLVYGEPSKHLKERSQLHKIVEPHCWIFGPRFHLASSDRSFREVIRKHRLEAELVEADEATIKLVSGVSDIPDLFLAATRDFPVEPRHHHLLVELKAPKVAIGIPEIDQVRRYARTILKSAQFEKQTTNWQIYIISGSVSEDAEIERAQKDSPHGRISNPDGASVWAFSWSEIIARAREEMELVREHLVTKSTELTTSDYLRKHFPQILDRISEKIRNGEKVNPGPGSGSRS